MSATDVRSVREIDPLELTSDGAHLTLRAWCLSAGGERSFRLDRILSVTVLDTPARRHRSRRRREGAREAETVSRGSTAVLVLEPAGRWLVEQVATEELRILPDGALRAVVHGRDESWLVALVLSAGRHLRDVEPAALRDRAAEAAAAALRLYGAAPAD